MKVGGIRFFGTYDTARAVSGLFAVIGWALALIGVFIVIGGLGAAAPFNALIAGIGLGIGAMGLLQVAAGQMLRATVDTADYSRQALLLQLAIAEGRTEIDLQQPSAADPEAPLVKPEASSSPDSNAQQSDISVGLSDEAIAILRKAKDRGYDIRFSRDKKAIVLSNGGWQATLSSNDDIVNFGRELR